MLFIEVIRLVLGKRIKALRKEKGLTQQQLEEKINVTKVSICCYENGTRTPTLQTLTDLAEFFGVNLNYFLGMDVYAVAKDEDPYQMSLCNEEVEFVMAIRKNDRLYAKLIENPKRLIQLINKKIK